MPYWGTILKTAKPLADKKLRTAVARAIDGQRVLGRLRRAFMKKSHILQATNY